MKKTLNILALIIAIAALIISINNTMAIKWIELVQENIIEGILFNGR